MNKFAKSKASLFLMEFILTLLLFSVCGAVCMQLFAKANSLSKDTFELNNAVACAQGFAEVMRGTDGSIDSIIEMYPGAVRGGDDFFEVFYDKDFNECEYEDAVYVGDVSVYPSGYIQNIDVKILRIVDYEEIYSLSVTKYMKIEESMTSRTLIMGCNGWQGKKGGCA